MHRTSMAVVWRRTAAVLLALFLVVPGFIMGTTVGPIPPCGAGLSPEYPPPGERPVVKVWHDEDLKRSGWGPPNCAGWASASHSKLVVAVAGSFRFDGTVDEVVQRIGAISALPAVRYWSVTDKAWRPLAVDASALSRPDQHSRRGDFLAEEMVIGRALYYWERHRRSGDIVYRMTVLDRSPTRAVIAMENVTPVRIFLMNLFESGSLQSVAFVESIAPGVWGVYFLTRAGQGASGLAVAREESYVNIATAMYEHLAGIQLAKNPSTRHLARAQSERN